MRHDLDEAVRRLRAAQHGISTKEQQERLGVTRSVTSDRVLAGRWRKKLPNIYVDDGWVSTFEGELLAATWSIPGAAASHDAAAQVLVLSGHRRGRVEVSVERGRHRARPFTVHSVTLLDRRDVATAGIQPVTTVARTLVDLAGRWPDLDISQAWADALRERRTSFRQLEAASMRAMGRGYHHNDRLLELLERFDTSEAVPESALEQSLDRIIITGGYGRACAQHPLADLIDMTGRVDRALLDVELVIEADGRRWHTRVEQFDLDRKRDRRLQAAGLTVMRFTYDEIVRDAVGVRTEIDAHFVRRGYVRSASGLWSPTRAA